MPLHILIAEPNRIIRNVLQQHLSAQGFEIIQTTDGNAAWELIRAQKPALVLMRAALPGLNSREIVRRVRADSQLAEIGILCLGEPITTNELVEWFKLGIDNYIDYPFSMRLLVAQVKAHLRRIHP